MLKTVSLKNVKIFPNFGIRFLDYKFRWKKKEVELKLSQIKEFLVNHLKKSIIPKITNIYNNRFPQYDAIKKNDTEQTFTLQWPLIVDVISGLIYLGFVTDLFRFWKVSAN